MVFQKLEVSKLFSVVSWCREVLVCSRGRNKSVAVHPMIELLPAGTP
ncbi:MAG: hypothetical protein QXV84_04410 [Conexivisphaerales archaeon]